MLCAKSQKEAVCLWNSLPQVVAMAAISDDFKMGLGKLMARHTNHDGKVECSCSTDGWKKWKCIQKAKEALNAAYLGTWSSTGEDPGLDLGN